MIRKCFIDPYVSRICATDHYAVYKKGAQIRIDSTLAIDDSGPNSSRRISYIYQLDSKWT